jgi:hypothetical protein
MRARWYDPDTDTSLVECHPVTGRTHQIRLHLQLVGNPIANDPCYGQCFIVPVVHARCVGESDALLVRMPGGELYFGDEQKMAAAVEARQRLQELGKCCLDDERRVLSLELAFDARPGLCIPGLKPLSRTPHLATEQEEDSQPAVVDNPVDITAVPRQGNETEDEFMTRTCRYCNHGEEANEYEAALHCKCIWLHALRYEGPGWTFDAPPPRWATLPTSTT